MKHLAAICMLFCACTIGLAQDVWFQDDFHRTSLDPVWKAATGTWRVENTTLKIQTASYDDLLASDYYAYDTQLFSVEVTLRGIRAGVYFALDDRATKVLSHMVRFDEKSILAGYFDGSGEFTATSVFEVPKLPTEWTKLRIDIDPLRRRYHIFVDGISVGVDTNLVFPSGFIGLQASEGISEFSSVKIYGNSPPSTPVPPKLRSKVSFAHLSFVQTRGKDLLVYHPELHQLMQIDSQGRLLSAEMLSVPPKPTTSVTIGDKIFSIVGKRVLISNPLGTVVDSIHERLVFPSCLAANKNRLFIADPGAKVIFKLSLDGRPLQTIDGTVIGGFKAPRGIAVYDERQLVIADYGKLAFWDEEYSKPPSVTPGKNGQSCRIEWKTNSPASAWLEFSSDEQRWIRVTHRAASDKNVSVQLNNLSPLTRYSFRYSPALATIPESFSKSKVFRFATLPSSPGMMAFSRLPLMCLAYRTISYRDRYPRDRFPQVPDGRTLTEDDISCLKRATGFNREFYFRNSGCRMVLDFDFYVVEDTLWLHEVGESDPYWLSPNDRVAKDFERAAQSFGKRPDEYGGLVCQYAWVNYPPRRTSALRDPSKKDTISIRQSVGGGTYGLPAPWKHGRTAGYTGNPFQDRFSRQDWLITHEFHHQIDALMDASGYPEYYHADQPWKMTGRFGEDFDFNAQIMRHAAKSSWLALRFGKLAQTVDADHDGVPDDDSTLPFDEKRLGGNPAVQDTDGDGASDLDEVMMGTSRSSALNNKDTDGDGLPDKIDPEPLYPDNPKIGQIGGLEELEKHPFGTIARSTISAKFFLAWTDSALLFSYVTDKLANLLFQIDADNDGWFHGFDNFQIRILNNGDSANVADYYLRDCSSWVNPPKDRRDILRPTDLGLTWGMTGGTSDNPTKRFRVSLRIPRNDQCGLRLVPGKRFSIRLGVQTSTDLWVWEELFERNYMMQVELQ